MGKRRPSGDGMVRKREDGRWEGRIVVGHKGNGDSIFRYIYADTQKELTTKLRQNIDAFQGVELTEQSKMTLAQWLDEWLEKHMTGAVRPDTLAGYRLQKSSPAIGAGVATGPQLLDFYGNTVPNPPSIGAHQTPAE